MFDYHMHSSFSADCEIPMEDMIEASIEKGVTEICFTDHVDYEYPDPNFIFDFDQQQYAKKIAALRKSYEGQITIKRGVEIGVQPHILQRCTELVEKEKFDFIICSMHTVDKKDLHFGEIFHDRSAEDAARTYYTELLHCVKNFDAYSILGHADLIKRYAKEPIDHDFHDVLTEIFNTIIPKGKGIELNTSGVRYGLNGGMPSDDILHLYKECGGEILTLGSDAHKPKDIAFQFRDSLELFQSIGFRYICTFDSREPSFHSIETLLG